MSEKRPFNAEEEGCRLTEFERHFGPIDQLGPEFLREMLRVD